MRTQKEIEQLMVEVNKYGNTWVLENFGISLTVPLTPNKRLKRLLGRCVSRNRGEMRLGVKELNISYSCLQEASEEFIYDVARHELVHYALYLQGKPFCDKDKYFKETCKKLNVPLSVSSEDLNKEMPKHYEDLQERKKRYEYKCDCQSHFFGRKLKRNYICTSCRTKLVLEI